MIASSSTFHRRLLGALSALSLAGAAAGCSSNPATGGSDIVFMSQADEKRIGDENHPKILKEFGGAYDDPALQNYITSLGQLLATSSELPNIKWTFTLLDSELTNAFALPGGYVYITRGLLSLAEDEDQLAAVIGHEIGHVTARHSAQRQAQGTLAQVGAMGASILGAALGGAQISRAVGQLAGTGAQAYVASYSRKQEFEADTLGIRYNSRVGYDPQGMAKFLAKLQSEKSLVAKLRGQSPRGSTYFDTHPPTPDRISRARQLASRTRVKDPINGRDIYLSKIDGLIWGDSPDQGYARDEYFTHEKLNIRFEVPNGFILFNSPSKVIAYGPNGATITFDSGPKNYGGSMYDYLRQTWGHNAKLSGVKAIKINGMDAATATARGKAVDIRLVAIQGKDGHTFRLTYLSPTNQTQELAAPYRTSMNTFRHMSRRELAQLRPYRIRLYQVRRGDTVRSIARNQMAMKRFALDRFKLLNGMSNKTGIAPGRIVKIISDR